MSVKPVSEKTTDQESTQKDLTSLVYLSRAHDWVTPEDIQRILDHSRQKNASLGVTGILLYRDRHFLQLIEGPAEEIKKVWAIIQGDRRHRDLILLEHGPASQRLFQDWTMGFRNLDENADSRSVEKVLPFFKTKEAHSLTQPELIRQALLTFRYL